MKHIRTLIFLLVAGVLAFSGCKKSSTAPKPVVQSITLKFNGTSYSSASPVAVYSKNLDSFSIIGNFGTNASVYLVIPFNFQIGTFDVASSEADASFFTGSNLSNTYYGTTGNVVITTFNSTTVAGTFQFTGTLANVTGVISSGQFQATYTTQ